MLQILKEDAALTRAHYIEMINEDAVAPDGTTHARDPNRQGLARELARMNATLNSYTQWYWKIDLHNLFHFLRLRADSHAQYEIRVYADVIGELTKAWVPAAYAAFEDYRLNAATLSGPARAVLKRMIDGETVEQPESGLSPGEWREFKAMIHG